MGLEEREVESRPLQGVRVVELAGLAPVPYCGMLLADFGAEVIRVDRPRLELLGSRRHDPLARGKKSVRLNLRHPDGVQILMRLLETADVLLDPFRPGVLERMGLAPDTLLARNPRLVVARLTGYGQTGPYACMAGHDINYVALSGALSLCGRAGTPPTPPANLLGDFAAGGLACALGVLLALIERARSGKGQVVDACMVDGAASLTTLIHHLMKQGVWSLERGTNWFDTGAPWYDTYETADRAYVAVGAFEPQFYADLLRGLGLDPETLPHAMDRSGWPTLRQAFAQRFREKTRAQWCEQFAGLDACVAPVLGLQELCHDPHMQARQVLVPGPGGAEQPNAMPRLLRTPGIASRDAPAEGQHTVDVLRAIGLSDHDIEQAKAAGLAKGPD